MVDVTFRTSNERVLRKEDTIVDGDVVMTSLEASNLNVERTVLHSNKSLLSSDVYFSRIKAQTSPGFKDLSPFVHFLGPCAMLESCLMSGVGYWPFYRPSGPGLRTHLDHITWAPHIIGPMGPSPFFDQFSANDTTC